MIRNGLFTSESVTEGHPDKIADQVSDALLDEMLSQDPLSRVACETMVTTGLAVLAGEVSSKAHMDFQKIVRQKIQEIGYDHSDKGFDSHTCAVIVALDKQSVDIAMGVDESLEKEQGAGDQGLMFGYAVNETPNLMPMTIDLAHKLAKGLSELRKTGELPYLRPDGKTQVTAEYEDGQIKRIDGVVVSSQHGEGISLSQLQEDIKSKLIYRCLPKELTDSETKIHINPTGRFVIGGPMGDCGLTGRKIIVDTYGGHGAHGGGAFSGKDPSKVDRSATYAAREVAKHVVAAGLADRALVQVAYAIGVSHPVSFVVNTFGSNKVPEKEINRAVGELFDMRPKAIIERLDLLRPIYSPTSAYGHFGREPQEGLFPWENLHLLKELKAKLS